MPGGRESEQLPLPRCERTDEQGEMLVARLVRVGAHTLPVVVGAAVDSRDGVALSLFACEHGRRMPQMGVEDHQGSRRNYQQDLFGQILAVRLWNDPHGRLVFPYLFGKIPRADLRVPLVVTAWKKRVVAVVYMQVRLGRRGLGIPRPVVGKAEVNVIALIGERGREVKEFIEENLGPGGLERSIVVAAASDDPPLVRLRGAYIATTIAEFFRNQGKNVILMMDSITRFALAQREIGLSVGEPPTTRGYTPSVFSQLPKLLERAGTGEGEGSITGLYTVLVEGDDLNEPISDAVRAILDGHIVLSRELASHNHYPAVDILNSVSRLMIDIVPKEHFELSMKIRDLLATYKDSEDLITIGAYARGSNPKLDYAISKIELLNQFLRQGMMEKVTMTESLNALHKLLED